MLRGVLRETRVCSKFRRRFYSDNAAVAAACTEKDAEPKPARQLQKARLWAMERISKHKTYQLRATKAWRIPGCVEELISQLPGKVGPLVYFDKLQVNQFYWKLGSLGFICTPFQLDVYEHTWEKIFEKSKIVASLEVYPHLLNTNSAGEIINLTLTSPKICGKRYPLNYFGEQDCIGVKKGGILKKDLTYLSLQDEVDSPLSDIVVDVSSLDIGEEITVQDLNPDFKLKHNIRFTTVVCKVLKPGEDLVKEVQQEVD